MPPASPPNTSPNTTPTAPLRQLRPSPIRPTPPPIRPLPPMLRSAAELLGDGERDLAREEARWAYYPYPVPRLRPALTGLYHITITAPSSRTTSYVVITRAPASPARRVGLGVFVLVVNLPWPSRHPLVIDVVINHLPRDTATTEVIRLTIPPHSRAATDPAALAAQLDRVLREIVDGASVAVSRVVPGRRWETGPPRNQVRAIDENGNVYIVAPRRHSGFWPTVTDGESAFPTEFGVVATPTGDAPVRQPRVRVVSAATDRRVSAASGSRSRGALRNFFNTAT